MSEQRHMYIPDQWQGKVFSIFFFFLWGGGVFSNWLVLYWYSGTCNGSMFLGLYRLHKASLIYSDTCSVLVGWTRWVIFFNTSSAFHNIKSKIYHIYKASSEQRHSGVYICPWSETGKVVFILVWCGGGWGSTLMG